MPSCFAVNCTSRNANHRLPSDNSKRKIWLNKIRRETRGLDLEKARLCSKHFSNDMFERDLKAELMGTIPKKILKANAIPNINLPSSKAVLKRKSSERRADSFEKRQLVQEAESSGMVANVLTNEIGCIDEDIPLLFLSTIKIL